MSVDFLEWVWATIGVENKVCSFMQTEW